MRADVGKGTGYVINRIRTPELDEALLHLLRAAVLVVAILLLDTAILALEIFLVAALSIMDGQEGATQVAQLIFGWLEMGLATIAALLIFINALHSILIYVLSIIPNRGKSDARS